MLGNVQNVQTLKEVNEKGKKVFNAYFEDVIEKLNTSIEEIDDVAANVLGAVNKLDYEEMFEGLNNAGIKHFDSNDETCCNLLNYEGDFVNESALSEHLYKGAEEACRDCREFIYDYEKAKEKAEEAVCDLCEIMETLMKKRDILIETHTYTME